MAWRTEGIPRNVEPAGTGEKLVGMFTGAKEVDQTQELARVLGADVGSLTKEVLGVLDTTNEGVDARVAEAGVDDDGAADSLTGRLQQVSATVNQV